MNGARSVFLSVRPEYAEAILSGEKHVELRRRPPRVEPGTLVLVYATSPVCAVVGAFVLDGLEEDAPTKLWIRVGSASGVPKRVFMRYFEALHVASALRVGTRWRLEEPVSLATLRKTWCDFHPPQSYRYLTTARNDDKVVLAMAGRPVLDVHLRPAGRSR